MQKTDYRSAIAQQPQMLDAARPLVSAEIGAMALDQRRFGNIVITGIGASYYAALAAAPYWQQLGLGAHAVSSGALYGASAGIFDLVVALSASGRSVEPIRALGTLTPKASIGVTSAGIDGNPLAPHVDAMIRTHCTVDSSPNTASFVGTVQALGLLGEHLSGRSGDWASLHNHLERAVAETVPGLAGILDGFESCRFLDLVGNGGLFGIAGYGSLLLREFARLPAQPWNTHNFLHGPMEPNEPGTGVIVLGDERELALADDLAGRGILTLLLTSSAGIKAGPNLRVLRLPSLDNAAAGAITAAAIMQLIVVHLAGLRGFQSCVFRYPHKDTKIAP